MPGNDKPKYYLDACCFLAFLQNEPDRVDDVTELLEKSYRREIRIFTSVLSMTEVAFLESERDEGSLSAEAEKAIGEMFADTSTITFVEYNRFVAADARTIVRKAMVGPGKNIKPPDAIHLASALRIGAKSLYTYDDPLLKQKGFGIKVERPPKVSQVRLLP